MTSTSPTSASPYAARPWLSSYPDGVPADFDFPVVPLTRLLDDAAASFPSNVALAFLGATLTYRELKQQVDGFASSLVDLGVGKGDRVAIVLPNCPQNVIATFATLRLGAVVVQHNPLYTEAELQHQLADCGARVVVCLDRLFATISRVRRSTGIQEVVVTSIADYLPRLAQLQLRLPVKKARRARHELTASVPRGAALEFATLVKGGAAPAKQARLDPETDLAFLQYTGGTTGVSKGAMLTHHNLVSNAYMNRLWDTGAVVGKEVTLGVLPLFHAYGLTVCLTSSILLGGTLVLVPRFDLDAVLAAIETHKPTTFPGVPPIYKALADSPAVRLRDLRSLRICVSGAMRLPLDVQEQFERISGARLVEGYGMTETSPVTHANPVVGERRSGSIGLPLTGTHVRVVDQDDPTLEVPVGTPGEMAIGGPQVFAGYWGPGSARGEGDEGVFTEDGYVLTGDVVVMDPGGWFTVVDRKKELIIAGGFNVYPSEVEAVLLRLAGVAEAVVIGLPDRYRGETVKAYLVLEPGATLSKDDVLVACRAELAAFKIPRDLEFRAALPRTAVGKVQRRVLLEEELARVMPEAVPARTPGGRSRPSQERARAASSSRKAPSSQGLATAKANKPPVDKPPSRRAPVDKAQVATVPKTPTKRLPAKRAPVKKAVPPLEPPG